jgi:hypothetical protein
MVSPRGFEPPANSLGSYCVYVLSMCYFKIATDSPHDYTERERVALAWTEALTHIAETHAPDAAYDEVRRHFEDKELVGLTT